MFLLSPNLRISLRKTKAAAVLNLFRDAHADELEDNVISLLLQGDR